VHKDGATKPGGGGQQPFFLSASGGTLCTSAACGRGSCLSKQPPTPLGALSETTFLMGWLRNAKRDANSRYEIATGGWVLNCHPPTPRFPGGASGCGLDAPLLGSVNTSNLYHWFGVCLEIAIEHRQSKKREKKHYGWSKGGTIKAWGTASLRGRGCEEM